MCKRLIQLADIFPKLEYYYLNIIRLKYFDKIMSFNFTKRIRKQGMENSFKLYHLIPI